MTTNIDPQSKTVGELVRENPGRAKVFESFKIGFCCDGKVSLSEACAKKGIDPSVVIEALVAAEECPSEVDADALTLTTLANHIEETHHAYLREELPRLDFMTRKVAAVHGEHAPELHQIREVFVGFQEELIRHMEKEETVLFPMIREIENSDTALSFHCGSISNPIAQMEKEHDNAGSALEKFRSLTNDYVPPVDACNTYRALFHGLEGLEKDMQQHIHKENNVLFPKAIIKEAETAGLSPAT